MFKKKIYITLSKTPENCQKAVRVLLNGGPDCEIVWEENNIQIIVDAVIGPVWRGDYFEEQKYPVGRLIVTHWRNSQCEEGWRVSPSPPFVIVREEWWSRPIYFVLYATPLPERGSIVTWAHTRPEAIEEAEQHASEDNGIVVW